MTKRVLNVIVALMAVVFLSIVIALPINYLNAKEKNYIGDKWKIGFAVEEITPIDILEKDYYQAGFLSIEPTIITEVLDGMFVRALCLNDGRGEGLSIIITIDSIGIALEDTKGIRSDLQEFASLHNIKNINVIATHTHHTIDTLGLWGSIIAQQSGKDVDFMRNLKQKAVKATKNAFENMSIGNLYFSQAEGADLMQDLRAPFVFEEKINRLRFVPEDSQKNQIYIVNMAPRLDNLGQSSVLSSDYPYYIQQELEESKIDMMFIPSSSGGKVKCDMAQFEGDDTLKMVNYGKEVAQRLVDIDNAVEREIKNIISQKTAMVSLPVINPVMEYVYENNTISASLTLANGQDYKYNLATEISFLSLGDFIKVALMPGDNFPEIIQGGFLAVTDSHSGENSVITPFNNMVGDGDITLSFAMSNDAIGFIVPENDYSEQTIGENFEEAFSLGRNTAVILMEAMANLIGSSN